MSHLAASISPLPDSAAANAVLAAADPHLGPSHLTGRLLGGTCCASVRADYGDHFLLPQPSGATREKGRRLVALQRLAVNARRQRRRAEEALAEQRLLTREADHRVANGLQLVHCTLSLHAAVASEDAAREAIHAAARSVAAAAEAHRHLYAAGAHGSGTETTPDAEVYLRTLLHKLSLTGSGHGITATREVTLRAEPGFGTALPAGLLPRLGLITAELVTNALKHGTGSVLLELRSGTMTEGGGAVIAVSDQGVGFAPEFNPNACEGGSLGMRLVNALARPGRAWVDPEDRRRILVQLLDRSRP